MKITADLHIHSHYSRATSKNLDFEHLHQWAQIKGIQVVGSGDLSHPGWLQEMQTKLEPAEDGLFRLKDEFVKDVQVDVPPACRRPVRFMLTGEISSIYKRLDRVRKVHNVIFASSLDVVAKIQAELEKIGNIRSDGRPILGLDSRDLLEIILNIDPENYLIPAHIWTPWFSMLGSKSGFDSVEECFDDLTSHIFALETGLSSDPPMNWRVSNLDGYTLVSSSDAHSPPKLGREATLFNTELSYPAIFEALKSGSPDTFLGTLEFFPEEGKYHLDGHRKCGLRWEPQTTLAHNGLCAVCGKKVTVGVSHRVEMLADRPPGGKPTRVHPFHSIIPLPEILGEVHNVGPSSKKVKKAYDALLVKLGPEFEILLETSLDDIEQAGGSLLAEGIRRMRRGEVNLAAGYDGEFGVIKLFTPEERTSLAGQLHLFAPPKRLDKKAKAAAVPPIPSPDQLSQPALIPEPETDSAPDKDPILTELNEKQQAAVRCLDHSVLITAGPGTGKTRTLIHRIAHLMATQNVLPDNILAITFTNKAAGEMAERLQALLGAAPAEAITIKTFHAFAAKLLRAEGTRLGLPANFALADDTDREKLLKQSRPDLSGPAVKHRLEEISAAKNKPIAPDAAENELGEIYQAYQQALRQSDLLDFDDLILEAVRLLENHADVRTHYQTRFRWISVDEYQDINQAQYRLLRLLTTTDTNLCAIGDPDQAIYGFRGADRVYFLQFAQDFPQAQTITLDRNYRSTQLILDASGQVIAQSAESRPLALWTEAVGRAKLDVYHAPTHKAEAEYVVHEIEKMVGGTSYFSIDSGRVDDRETTARTFSDFAVLYRLGALSQPLLEAFERSGIPFQTVGQTPLYEYKEIKQILAFLWLCHTPRSRLHLAQLLSVSGITFKAKQLAKLADMAEADGLTLPQALESPESGRLFRKHARKIGHFLTELGQAAAGESARDLLGRVVQFVQAEYPATISEAGQARVQRLLRQAALFERLPDFLESTLLQRETDAYDPRADRVTLMTLHASKGLEFPVVFIVGCEEDLLPYRQAGQEVDLEEERRLLYVGMTRAQDKLVLTHARKRFLFGETRQPEPSRFLADIEQSLKAFTQMPARMSKKEKPDATQLPLL